MQNLSLQPFEIFEKLGLKPFLLQLQDVNPVPTCQTFAVSYEARDSPLTLVMPPIAILKGGGMIPDQNR